MYLAGVSVTINLPTVNFLNRQVASNPNNIVFAPTSTLTPVSTGVKHTSSTGSPRFLGGLIDMAMPMLGGLLGGGGSNDSGKGSDDDVNNFNINIGGTLSDDDQTATSSQPSSSGGGLLDNLVNGALGAASSAFSGSGRSAGPAGIQVPSVLPTNQTQSGFAVHDDLAPQISTLLPTLTNLDVAAGYENVARILSTPRPMSTNTISAAYTELEIRPSSFFSLLPVSNRLQYFRGATFTLCMKVHVTANAFCSGVSIVKYVPFAMTDAISNEGAAQYLPGGFIDLNNMSDYTLKIPYHAPYRMYDVNSLLTVPGFLSQEVAGYFRHVIYNDGPEPISYKVFIWLEDLQLFYPIVPTEDAPARVQPQGFKNKSINEGGHRLIISAAQKIDDVQGIPSNIKILNPVPTTTLLDDACPDSFDSLLTRPSFISIANTAKPGLKIVHTLGASDSVFFQDDFRFIDSRYANTSVSLIPFFFQYWACSYELTFKFYKTQFHKGLLAFAFVPLTLDPLDIDYADHYHEILDLSIADTVTLRIPFISDNSRFILGDSPGTIICSQIVPLSHPDTVAASISYTVSVRACEDLVYSVPNLNSFSPLPVNVEPVPVTPQGVLGPDMPIPPEYNSSGSCTISAYFTFAQRHNTYIRKAFFFTFAGTNTSRKLIMASRHAPVAASDSLSRTSVLSSCYYGSRCELVLDNPERLFIYDKYGQTPPPRSLVPYLSNLKYTYTFLIGGSNISVNAVAANFQGFYQWFIPNVVSSNLAWLRIIDPNVRII
jgi:hypothetical protein